MAEKQVTFQFKNVQLFKDQSLGVGSYGAVCKAKCDDLLCAAKIIHPTLFDLTALQQIAPQREHRLPIRRFEQECEFMSAIRHPNIVQYLGMFRDTNTQLPVLLMELMDDSLTHFLECSTQPIPYHIQVNICHDVALALSFLHSHNIIHRDLSSNNVLLRSNVLAKVTDFGMAKLGDLNSQATHFTNTICPGTEVYMPPEAVQDKPVYMEKIDCFSFGVVIVQILTRQFPNPGDRLQRVELNHPGLPMGSVLVEVSEIDRRQNHISQITPNHPLQPIALDCLKDERPSAHQLCERIAALKGMPNYNERIRVVQENVIIQAQASCIEENDSEHTSSKDKEVQQLRQLQQENDEALKKKAHERELQLGRLNQQLEKSEQLVAQLKRKVAELEQQLREKQHPISFKLKWRKGKKAPCATERWYDAVVDGNIVYIRKEELVEIYSYDISSESWSQLPNCVHGHSSMAVINGWLTAIGGWCPSAYTNELFSLTGEGSGRRWTKKFPPMPTKRQCTTALCTGTTLIVIGGWGAGGVLLTVEVMNTESQQWSTAADLPEPLYNASATCAVYGDQLYMLGGLNKDHTPAKSVYTCLVSALLQSCVSNSVEDGFKRTSLEEKASIWRQLDDLSLTRSTCQSFHDRLLAIGGKLDSKKSSKSVYMYQLATDSWRIISHMTTGRYGCFTAVLPENQLMVVGGCISEGKMTDSIEFASVC